MNCTNVKLILAREVRDQLRDRRTLFMIFVLPILLYPLLGMSFFQVVQFMREQPTRVLVVGLPRAAAGLPPLFDEAPLRRALFAGKPERAGCWTSTSARRCRKPDGSRRPERPRRNRSAQRGRRCRRCSTMR